MSNTRARRRSFAALPAAAPGRPRRRIALPLLIALGLTAGLVAAPGPFPTTQAWAATDSACPEGVIAEDWFIDTDGPYEAAIDCLWHWGITAGTSPTRYSPSVTVNREQMAAFIARLIKSTGGTLPSSPRDAFGDDESSPFEHQINQLAAVGIVAGKRPGVYAPGATVTRGQMAAFLTRAYDYRAGQDGLAPLPPGPNAFPDDVGNPLEGAINTAAAAGFVGGYTDGTFRPANAVRRDHMAAFLTRLLDTVVDESMGAVPQW